MIFLGKFRTCFITYLEAQMSKININWTQARLWYNLQLHQVVSPDRISNPLKSRSACFKNVRSSNDIALFECGVAGVVAVDATWDLERLEIRLGDTAWYSCKLYYYLACV